MVQKHNFNACSLAAEAARGHKRWQKAWAAWAMTFVAWLAVLLTNQYRLLQFHTLGRELAQIQTQVDAARDAESLAGTTGGVQSVAIPGGAFSRGLAFVVRLTRTRRYSVAPISEDPTPPTAASMGADAEVPELIDAKDNTKVHFEPANENPAKNVGKQPHRLAGIT